MNYCIIIYISIFPFSLNTLQSNTFNVLDIVSNILLSLVVKENYLQIMSVYFEKTYNLLNLKRIMFSYILYLVIALIFVIRLIFTYTFLSITDWCVPFPLIVLMSLFSSYISKVIVFDVIYHIMKAARMEIDVKHFTITATQEEEIKTIVDVIKKVETVYHNTLDIIRKINIEIGSWVSIIFMLI